MVQKKKRKKVKKKKSKSIVYQRKQKQKQPRQKQSQSIVVHIHPKKTKSRPRFKNYSHEKAQKYFSSHYQTMAQSRAGYSLYNTLQVKKVLDALKGEKDKAAELREFYVNKYGPQMAPKVKSVGVSTEKTKLSFSDFQNVNIEPEEVGLTFSDFQNVNIEPEEMKEAGLSFSDPVDISLTSQPRPPQSPRPPARRGRLRGREPRESDEALRGWGNSEGDLYNLTMPDLMRRAQLFEQQPVTRYRLKADWVEFNKRF